MRKRDLSSKILVRERRFIDKIWVRERFLYALLVRKRHAVLIDLIAIFVHLHENANEKRK